MACITFTDLKTATESLSKRIVSRAFLSNIWLNAVPRGTYPKGTGTTQTTFTFNNSEPDDTDALGDEISLNVGGQPVSGSPALTCPNDYPEVPVGFSERTYSPRRLNWRGQLIGQDQLTYQHNVIQFLNGYETRLMRNAQRRIEFASRQNYISMIGIMSDGVFYEGPDALSSVVLPTSDITQGQLDIGADYLLSHGASEPDSDGFIMMGGAGVLFTLEIKALASQRILKSNDDRSQAACWAMANELWRRIGATTVIGNWRHVPTHMAPRFNDVGGVPTQVRTFRSADEMNAAGDRTTAEYKAAEYELAIAIIPYVMTFEQVVPEGYKFGESRNYLGELNWYEGGYRVQSSGCYDPENLIGGFFGRLEYAARPDDPSLGIGFLYKRPPNDVAASDIYSYPGAE